jgi:dolichol-phosphate mannosyltransferase
MYKNNKIGIVIPAYNVEKEIGAVLKDIPDYVDHIVVVDDASADGTLMTAKISADSRVDVLSHAQNKGVGGAVVTGLKHLLSKGADIIAKADGDGQMDLSQLYRLLDALIDEHYAYAKGNRFIHTKDIQSMPLVRLIGNFILTFLTKLCSGYWNVFDPQNGYLAVRREYLQLIDLDNVSERYFFENDMLVHLNIFHLRVKDVSMPAIYHHEKSSMKIHQILLTFPVRLLKRTIYRIYQKYILRDFSQIALFLISGIVFMSWGVLFGGYHWVLSWRTGQYASTGTVMVALLPFLMGFELFLQGIILDIQNTPK